MRTRTLLLLAVTCGLAVLLAGGIQLLRLANQDTAAALSVGDRGTAGDAQVLVRGFDESDGRLVVEVTLSGVDDPDGLDGFTLVGVPDPVEVVPNGGAGSCTGFTVEPVECTLTFATNRFETGDRLLMFIRAATTVRWRLA